MDYFRFPHTPHLAWLGSGVPRDDKVLDGREVERFLERELVVEEKVDGANLGISVDDELRLRFQMRGQYLSEPYAGQFSRLTSWASPMKDELALALSEGLVLFGEWCAARHSLDYDALPDWFLVFDVYDRVAERFWSTSRRDRFAARVGLSTVPRIAEGVFRFDELKDDLLQRPSCLRNGVMEGIVLRREDDDWGIDRSKLVRPEFVQSIEAHWSSKGIEWNRLCCSCPAPATHPGRARTFAQHGNLRLKR